MRKKHIIVYLSLIALAILPGYYSNKLGQYNGLMWLNAGSSISCGIGFLKSFYRENNRLPRSLAEAEMENPTELSSNIGHRYLETFYDNMIDPDKQYPEPPIILANYNPLSDTQWVVLFTKESKDNMFVKKSIPTPEFEKWYHQWKSRSAKTRSDQDDSGKEIK